ncbi:MAG: glycogen synthase GlgA [Pseudomonadota bacterium]
MKIAFISSEVVPFAKTGGLADVAGTLPKALGQAGVKVAIIMPFYNSISAKTFGIKSLKQTVTVPVGDKKVAGKIFQTSLSKNVEVFFIQQPAYFDREYLYQTKAGDYPDNSERFSFFAKAALELIASFKTKCDLIHCHDWQAALVPVYLKTLYKNNPALKNVKTVLTIHNLGYQGLFEHMDMPMLNLDWSLFTFDKLEFYGKINFLKAGIVFADKITTVSKKYAQEILTPEYGCGLEAVLHERKKDIVGILNGIDYSHWDPATDKLIPKKYSAKELKGKDACRTELQKCFKLPVRKDVPIMGIISRLATQKGFDLLEDVIPSLIKANVQVVVLGTGEPHYHELFQTLAQKYPKDVGVALKFDNSLAHLIEAGSDFFLMPSRYEPCGLNQMISMKYGTIPVVRATGGLDDSVTPFNKNTLKGNGFKFQKYDAQEFIKTLNKSLTTFRDQKTFKKLILNAMKTDFSWNRSAEEYIELYEKIRSKKKQRR